MSSALQFDADTGCIRVVGELTIYQANAAAESLRSAFESGSLRQVDLAGVTELDTAGLQLLLMAERPPANGEAPVVLVNHSQPVRDVLELLGVGVPS